MYHIADESYQVYVMKCCLIDFKDWIVITIARQH